MDRRQKKDNFLFFRIFNGLSDSTSFRRRIFLSFILIVIPSMVVICISSFLILQTTSRAIIRQTQETELEKLSAQLHAVFNDTENMSREIIYSTAIQEFMSSADAGDPYPEDSAVDYYINGFVANRDYVNSVVLTGTDHTLFSTEDAYTDMSAFRILEQRWWYRDLIAQSDPYVWYSYAQLDSADYRSQQSREIPIQINTMMLARPIYSISDHASLLGYLIIYLDNEYMQKTWRQISWGNTTNAFLLNKDDEIIASNSSLKDYSGLLSEVSLTPGNSSVLVWNKENYVFSCSDMDMNGWKICMVTPYGEINRSATILMAEMFVILGICIAILFLLSSRSAYNMSRPVIHLSELMDSYHGREDEFDPDSLARYKNRTDEIGQMYRSYEQMADRLEHLIQEIYVKNLEKKDAELALLQSQINPHFLYNTLDSINWIALANGQDEISEMITALSDTFRLSLMKNNSSFVEMDQEIQYIKSYLMLQKFRYGERLSYTFDLPEELPPLYIPRFILQPVVENSLKHGISRMEGGGTIQIRIVIGSEVVITVVNDGSDIDLEKMKNLLVFDPNKGDILAFKQEGYGVQNIHRRIKIICGDDYGLSYEKTRTQTVCRIVLPVRTEL